MGWVIAILISLVVFPLATPVIIALWWMAAVEKKNDRREEEQRRAQPECYEYDDGSPAWLYDHPPEHREEVMEQWLDQQQSNADR